MSSFKKLSVVVFDGNPIHVAAFRAIVGEAGTFYFNVCDSVDEMTAFPNLPDLIMVNMADERKCSNLLLLRVLGYVPDVPVLCYSPERWSVRGALQQHVERLVVLTCEEITTHLAEYLVAVENDGAVHGLSFNRAADSLSHEHEDLLECLSPRETDVFCLLGKGYAIFDVAELFGVGTETVKTHLKGIRKKLKLKGIAELRRMSVKFAQVGLCRAFRESDSHICQCSEASTGNCPLKLVS